MEHALHLLLLIIAARLFGELFVLLAVVLSVIHQARIFCHVKWS